MRAYFAVKSQAADDLSVQIDAQERYLTARDATTDYRPSDLADQVPKLPSAGRHQVSLKSQ